MEANCARCGRKVKSEENWLRPTICGRATRCSIGIASSRS